MTTSGRARTADDSGVTLVEVMVAMVLFVVGSLSLLSVLTSSMTGTFDNRARLTAANLAATDIDEARSQDYYSLSPADYTRTVDGRSYRVVREVTVTMASGSSTSSCVGSGSAKQLHKKVSTRVETAFRGSTRPVRADTLVRAPIFDPSSPRGAIGFTVADRNGTPLSGLPVAVPGINRTTDANGCTFFDGLDPGDYAVTVTRSGSVTRAGSSTLSKTVRVSPGQITADSMRVDTAVPVTVMSNVFNGSTAVTGFTPPTGMTATIAASDRAAVTRITYPSKSVTLGTDLVWSAYPSPGGYDAWLGPCSPVGHSDSEPGTTPPRTVLPLSPVTVVLNATSGGDNPKGRGKSVSVTWLPTSCSEPYSFATSTKSDCNATSEGADACVVYLGVPAGTWNFKIDGATNNVNATVAPRTAQTVKINLS